MRREPRQRAHVSRLTQGLRSLTDSYWWIAAFEVLETARQGREDTAYTVTSEGLHDAVVDGGRVGQHPAHMAGNTGQHGEACPVPTREQAAPVSPERCHTDRFQGGRSWLTHQS